MAGRGRGRGRGKPMPKNNNKSNSRRRNPGSGGSALFVDGGFLSDWSSSPGMAFNQNNSTASRSCNSDKSKASGSKTESRKASRNAIKYQYSTFELQDGMCPQSHIESNNGDNIEDGSCPVILVDTKQGQIIAYVDQTPCTKPPDVDYTYDYSSNLGLDDFSHQGLGFSEESEVTPSGIGTSSKKIEEEQACFDSSLPEKELDSDENSDCEDGVNIVENLLGKMSPQKNSGFLSIGGMKLYTQDISDEDDDGESVDGRSSESCESSSESDDSEDTSNSNSDIDDEIAEDYMEGIGGSNKFIDLNWLEKQDRNSSNEDDSLSSSIDRSIKKLGGISLRKASSEYGLKKPSSRKNYPQGNSKSRDATDVWSLALEDLTLVKDPRAHSKKKKQISSVPKSFLYDAPKRNNFRNYPGEKKKHRKETIALKRRERMMLRGVDLERINWQLEQMVLNKVDMQAFQTMHSRDCSQVQRLAAIYGLRSGCQGSGKKRFVTVTRTERTGMPSSTDKLRLDKLIGAGIEDADFVVNKDLNYSANKGSKRSAQGSSKRHSSEKSSEKKTNGRKGTPYANQPLSFVSSGILQSDTVETETAELKETNDIPSEDKGVASSSIGAFEVHTKGFGSKMMAKMGFIEGKGLGKEGQGMAKPIEVIKRPKSLGLGVQFSETDGDKEMNQSQRSGAFEKNTERVDKGRNESKRIGAFEMHTRGFGSKMMAKMGFVEGLGLGKDSQGIVNPLVAVRRPRSQGLGAKG